MSDPNSAFLDVQLRDALTLHGQGQLDAAATRYRAILSRAPAHFDALHLLGVACLQQGNLAEAERLIGAALQINPRHAPAQSNYGVTLRGLKRAADALTAFDQAVALQGGVAENHYNRGLALMDLERFAEAMPALDRAVALNPNHADAQQGRSATLERLGRYADSIAACDAALRLRPNDSATLYNRAKAHYFLGNAAAAQADFRRSIALQPNFAEAHWGLAESLLMGGADEEGWREYEWRFESRVPTGGAGGPMIQFARTLSMPLWQGEDLSGKTILLHAEQGYGDTLQFYRYVDDVARRAGRVVIEVQAPLKRLLEGSSSAVVILARGEALPAADYHCPLLSLPRVLGLPSDRRAQTIPYAAAPVALIAERRERIEMSRRPLVGLVWYGMRDAAKEQHRSIPPSLLSAFDTIDATFVSLQLGLRPEDRDVAFIRDKIVQADDLRDFADTAALIAALDLVITVDTANAHLAGAMGKPVWVLLAAVGEWRWGANRETTPWYPSARLFRQETSGDWGGVIARVCDALRARGEV